MKNIHIIPIDKPSRLVRNSNENTLKLCIQTLPLDKEIYCYPQHIYITSDEQIQEGVENIWYYDSNFNKVTKWKGESNNYVSKWFKKIILTIDQDLIKDGVQSIDDDFLEWFVKNPSCEEVETIIVSTWCNNGKVCVCNVPKFCNEKRNDFKYKIIIPKEEPKQETLEEASLRLFPKVIADPYNPFEDLNKEERNIWIEGAKWKQERSDIEANKIIEFLDNEAKLKISDTKTIERVKWYFETYFEQFKKK